MANVTFLPGPGIYEDKIYGNYQVDALMAYIYASLLPVLRLRVTF